MGPASDALCGQPHFDVPGIVSFALHFRDCRPDDPGGFVSRHAIDGSSAHPSLDVRLRDVVQHDVSLLQSFLAPCLRYGRVLQRDRRPAGRRDFCANGQDVDDTDLWRVGVSIATLSSARTHPFWTDAQTQQHVGGVAARRERFVPFLLRQWVPHDDAGYEDDVAGESETESVSRRSATLQAYLTILPAISRLNSTSTRILPVSVSFSIACCTPLASSVGWRGHVVANSFSRPVIVNDGIPVRPRSTFSVSDTIREGASAAARHRL